jgi:hypothetical protein
MYSSNINDSEASVHIPDDLLVYSWTSAPKSEGLSSNLDGLLNSFSHPVKNRTWNPEYSMYHCQSNRESYVNNDAIL